MKLLLIEDDDTTVESITLCMEIYEPTARIVATNKGLAALQMLKNDNYDAVLIDLGLPDIDGLDVIEQMRGFSAIPAVVLSARHGQEVIARALESGADDYITKPFDYQVLMKRLHKLVDKSKDIPDRPSPN